MAEPKKPEILKAGDPRRIVRLDAVDEKLELFARRGILFCAGPIADSTANALLLGMTYLRMSNPEKPMWIILNSPGGQVDEGLAIVDTIRAFINKGSTVNILGVGLVASMAVCIMQAGSRRFAFPNTQFMIHEVSQVIMAREKASESDERNAEIKRINNIVVNLIAERSGIEKVKLMASIHKTDLWLEAKDAKSFGTNGLIDEVVDTFPFDV